MRIRQIRKGWCKSSLHATCKAIAIAFLVVDVVFLALTIYLCHIAFDLFAKEIRKAATNSVYINTACFGLWVATDCLLLYWINKKWGKQLVRWSVLGVLRAVVSLVLMVVFSVTVMDDSLSDNLFAGLMASIALILLVYVDAQLYLSLLVYNLGKAYKAKKVAFRDQKSDEQKT